MNQKEALAYAQGKHNLDIEASIARLKKGRNYEDNSTIILTPTIGTVPSAVLPSWFGMIQPMNTGICRIFVEKQEVGEAYESTIESICQDKTFSKFKYLLTLEADNIPPANGLLLLLESIANFDAVGGLYWTKGEGGQPMIYGDPTESPINFRPQIPIPDAIQPACGLGMGFTLFRLGMLRDRSISRPLFRTAPGSTQDLFFFKKAAQRGYRFASDNRVKVGHYDHNTGVTW